MTTTIKSLLHVTPLLELKEELKLSSIVELIMSDFIEVKLEIANIQKTSKNGSRASKIMYPHYIGDLWKSFFFLLKHYMFIFVKNL